MEDHIKPAAATHARPPSTPDSQRRQSKNQSPRRSSHAHALFERFEDLAAAGRRASAASDPVDALCDVVHRACMDSVARRVPTPRALAVEWVPRFVTEFAGVAAAGARDGAAALRRAVRARCVRPPLELPEDAKVASPARARSEKASADATRRRLRDAELQILLRVVLAKRPKALSDRDGRAVQAVAENASFALQAPHVECEPPRRSSSRGSGDYLVDYASLRSFFDTALAPPLRRLAPATLAGLRGAFEFDAAAEPRRHRGRDRGGASTGEAWPARPPSMVPPAKRAKPSPGGSSVDEPSPPSHRSRIIHCSQDSEKDDDDSQGWANFCAADTEEPPAKRPRRAPSSAAEPAAAPAPAPRKKPAAAPPASQPLRREASQPLRREASQPLRREASQPLRRAGSLDRAGSLRALGAASQRRALGLGAPALARAPAAAPPPRGRAPPPRRATVAAPPRRAAADPPPRRASAAPAARAPAAAPPAPAASPAASRKLKHVASPSPPRQRGGARAAQRRRVGGAAARRSGPTSAPAAPEPSPPRRRVVEDTPDQDEPQMPARIKHKRARDQGKDDVRGRLAF